MFDNSKPNVIILADATEPLFLTKTFGPYKVAHELRKAGIECAVIHHLHVFTFQEIQDILTDLITDQTLYVGFSTYFYHWCNDPDFWSSNMASRNFDSDSVASAGAMLPHGANYNSQLIKHIQSCNPNCKTVLGGPNALDKQHNRDFDFVVTGYADISAVNLAQHLQQGTPLTKSYRSIWGFTVVNDTTAQGFDFSNSTMNFEPHDAIMPGETLQIELSRGCIFQCAYCSYPLNGKHKLDFLRSEQRLREEFMRNYEQWGVTRYMFLDDTFNDSVEKVQMLLNVSQSLPFQLEYWAYARLDLVAAHPETADMLWNSGMRAVSFGIETWDKTAGTAIGKSGTPAKQQETLRYLRKISKGQLMIHGNFIVGLPHEDAASISNTFKFLCSEDNALDSWVFWPLSIENSSDPTPGQPLSKISMDPRRYGYRNLRPLNGVKQWWENDHFNWDTARDLASKLNTLSGKRIKYNGRLLFELAGTGVDIEQYVNQPQTKVLADKSQFLDQKNIRAMLYKATLASTLPLTIGSV